MCRFCGMQVRLLGCLFCCVFFPDLDDNRRFLWKMHGLGWAGPGLGLTRQQSTTLLDCHFGDFLLVHHGVFRF